MKTAATGKARGKAKAKARELWNRRMLERRRAVQDLNDLAEQLDVTRIPVIKPATPRTVESLIHRVQKLPAAATFARRLYAAAVRWKSNGGALRGELAAPDNGSASGDEAEDAHEADEVAPRVILHKVLVSGYRIRNKAFMLT